MKWLKRILNFLGNGDHILVVVAVLVAVILCLIPFQVCLGEDSKELSTVTNRDTTHFLMGQTKHQGDIGPKEMQSQLDAKYEYAFSYGLFVHHYESKKANEGFENRMIAIERKGLVFSYFDNSYNEDTVFLGYGWHSDKYYSKYSKWWTRGNLYLGGLVGYGDKNPVNYHGLGFGVYPTASIGYERYSIEMGVMPTFVWWGFKVEF